jgi:hypothetical protein
MRITKAQLLPFTSVTCPLRCYTFHYMQHPMSLVVPDAVCATALWQISVEG